MGGLVGGSFMSYSIGVSADWSAGHLVRWL
jgi:hypothetical protein